MTTITDRESESVSQGPGPEGGETDADRICTKLDKAIAGIGELWARVDAAEARTADLLDALKSAVGALNYVILAGPDHYDESEMADLMARRDAAELAIVRATSPEAP